MPQIASGNVSGARMKLDVGGVERRAASTSTYAYRLTVVNFTYTVVAATTTPIAPAHISATNPASLTEATLNGTTVTVTLGGATASSFALVTSPAITGLSVSNVTGGASGSTSATLALAFTADFDTAAALAVRVLAAAHSGSADATTGNPVPLAPADEAPSFGAAGGLALALPEKQC